MVTSVLSDYEFMIFTSSDYSDLLLVRAELKLLELPRSYDINFDINSARFMI